ncbi:hypothetical protein SLS60_004524 [Paraconiothyrium brasiliense]|uniref:DUF8212 domain-containing protein n=1 Tax=Paraconiothyrium brasiliense TaxID=300254 RepID=A0ABR3RL25_9PLEO
MRLLNASTIRLESFHNEAITPRYAILSHTWGDEEVSFQDLDSAELSEAINSMFKWYRKSAICYAYLEDIRDFVAIRGGGETSYMREDAKVERQGGEAFNESYLAKARWFTRGWTLQELIAPHDIVFYAKGWKTLGRKSTMAEVLENITGIAWYCILGSDLNKVSVAQRMSWASKRQTTRSEDIAYCLLGIFDVNMPLLYGEGEKAFSRLQEEIMKNSDDQSLFAWVPQSAESLEFFNLRPDFLHYRQRTGTEIKWKDGPQITTQNVRGMFAKHPSEFSASHTCLPWTPLTQTLKENFNAHTPYMLTNKGVEILLPIIPLVLNHDINVAVLHCTEASKGGSLIGIIVQGGPEWPGQQYRRDGYGLVRVSMQDLGRHGEKLRKVYLSKRPLVEKEHHLTRTLPNNA